MVVLQGYGITVDLVGTTFISKAGITSTTFKTVPDQRDELPEGEEGKESKVASQGQAPQGGG